MRIHAWQTAGAVSSSLTKVHLVVSLIPNFLRRTATLVPSCIRGDLLGKVTGIVDPHVRLPSPPTNAAPRLVIGTL
jgi:hypothetical protein